MAKTMLVAKESFRGGLPDGEDFTAVAGRTRIWADHAAAKLWPHLFEPVIVTHDSPDAAPVEQATAAPGEKRGG